MNIVITGGAGFLGQRLAKTLLAERPDAQLTLVDVIKPTAPNGDARARCIEMDLRDPAHLGDIITPETDAVFHLAAIVSSHAEAEPDLGYEINFLATRNLLEAIRHTKPSIRFIFSSSLAVFGGKLPEVIQDSTAVTPQSTYGTQKGMCELLINDYTRKGFADGLALRLPTVCIRPGKPNKAASSFVSGIMREPLQGEDAVLPVSPALRLWLSSPDTVVANFIHALDMPSLPPTGTSSTCPASPSACSKCSTTSPPSRAKTSCNTSSRNSMKASTPSSPAGRPRSTTPALSRAVSSATATSRASSANSSTKTCKGDKSWKPLKKP